MKYQIKHCLHLAVLFEFECGSLKLCVEAAVKARANLGGAYLGGAYLRGANLGGHQVNGDIGIIAAGDPNNWSAIGFVDQETGALIVSVGCRVKEIGEGRAYWSSADHHDLQNRRDVLVALDYIEAVAKLRGWSTR
jgi:hypothetical protein